MFKPKEMRERLADGDTDPVFCKEVLAYVEDLERRYKAACANADDYKQAFYDLLD